MIKASGFGWLLATAFAAPAGEHPNVPASDASLPAVTSSRVDTRLSDPVAGTDWPGRLPASFEGTLPCADCPGIHHTLTVFDDGSYRLRQVYVQAEQGRDRAFVDLGRWSYHPGSGRLTAYGGDHDTSHWWFDGPDRLNRLDHAGRPIPGALNDTLSRTAHLDRVEDPHHLRGLYTHLADAASFIECRTRHRYPVSFEGDHYALEAAYLEARQTPGERMIVEFEGRFAQRTAMDGPGSVEMIVVEHFVRRAPNEDCDPMTPDALLEGTYWKLVDLNGTPIATTRGLREAHLVLGMAGSRFRGHGGCNRITGGYRVHGEALDFTDVTATPQSCPRGMVQEQALLDTLEAVARYRIKGDALELASATRTLARLEAVYLY